MNIFVLYTPEDAHYWQQLQKHLAELQRQNVISTYHEGSMTAGSTIAAEMQTYLDRADMVLLLVSPDFIASDRQYHYAEQAQNAQKRIVPILVRPCMWQDPAWGKLAPLPTSGKAVSQYDKADDGFFEVAQGLRKLIEPDWEGEVITEIPPPKHSVTHHNTSVDQSNKNQTNVTGEGNTVIQGVTGSTIHIHQATTEVKTEDTKAKPWLKIAGVLILLAVIALSMYYFTEQAKQPFDLSVFVQDSLGNAITDPKHQAEVSFNLGQETYKQKIDEAGKVHFAQLPANLKSEKVKISVRELPHLTTAYPDSLYQVNSGRINLKVVADGSLSKIYGRVQDSNGTPLPHADISLQGTPIVSVSDERGNFILEIPQQYQRSQVSIAVQLYGYTTLQGDNIYTTTAYPSLTKEEPIVILLVRNNK